MIGELIATTGEARVTDLARRLGVTHVTVNRTIQRLRRLGPGHRSAIPFHFPHRRWPETLGGSRHRHELVADFLRSLGVPSATAHADAEGMEHHVSKETLAAFAKHLKNRG